MDILKRLLNWCRKPKKPFLAKFSRLATQLHVRVGTTSRNLVLAIALTVVLIGALGVTHMLTSHMLASQHPDTEIVGTIHITDDGSVDPPTALIQQDGNLYILTANILALTKETYITRKGYGVKLSVLIYVERSNIIIDGNGYTVEAEDGEGTFFWIGNGLRIRNVTVKNMNIKKCGIIFESASNCAILGNNITNSGIGFSWSYNNTIFANNITNSFTGVSFQWSSNNTVSRNNINNNSGHGVYLYWSSNNTFRENVITNNDVSFDFVYSSNNRVYENNITNNESGIRLYTSSNNTFYYNNFVNNAQQVYDRYVSKPSINVWDNGYSSGGNYWSDYTGVDLDHDGIGDAPNEIDANNTDHYPLIDMF